MAVKKAFFVIMHCYHRPLCHWQSCLSVSSTVMGLVNSVNGSQ